ncbi:MAG: DnaJ domain-containing protein [Lentisphaeria bacterium]|jgi:hypothetical protein
MESNIEILFLDVETSPSQLEKAKAERRLLEAITNATWNEKVASIAAHLKDKQINIRARARLLNASPLSDNLWPSIDNNEITLSGAITKLHLLEDEAGIPRRKIKPKIDSSVSNEIEVSVPPPPPPPSSPPKKLEDKFSVLSEIAILTSRMTELLRKKNPNLQEDSIEFLVREVELDLKRSIEIMKIRANKTEKLGEVIPKPFSTLDRKAMTIVYGSCDLLGVNRPKKGRLVDLDSARKQMRIRCKPYHPDVNQGDKEAEKRFREIVEAYSTLEEYNVSLSSVVVF